MSQGLRTFVLLCLFGGLGLIGLFLNLRPTPPQPILYKTTSVNFQEHGKVCPSGLDFDPRTGDRNGNRRRVPSRTQQTRVAHMRWP